MDANKLKPCPFCGSIKLDISCKTATGALINGRIYRTSVYCKSCNTYGPRATVRIAGEEGYWNIDKYDNVSQAKDEAIKLWNKRSD